MDESILSTAPIADNGRGRPVIEQAVAPADPFDPARLRLSQDFATAAGVKKALLNIPVRKPASTWFVQVHPDEKYRLSTGFIEIKEDRELYLVAPELYSALAAEATFGPRALFTAITRQGLVFFWPIRLPGPDGRIDSWNASALEAATMASGNWCRVVSNFQLAGYEVFPATGELSGPQWPEEKLSDLLRIAFKNFYVDSVDHPVLRRLRGEI